MTSAEPNDVATMEIVRDFYQRHPYPPPVEDLDRYRQRWDDEHRRRADFHLFEPTKPYRDRRNILVAGCGTSQAAKYAIQWPNSQVTGIDVSSTSIEHSNRLKTQHQLDNLTLKQLPIERAQDLGESFDVIVCTGVLHHLTDPGAGLRALSDVLDPEGHMHLMVYAPYGRTGIYLLQEYCRRLDVGISSEEIASLAASLRMLPPTHPLRPLLDRSPDFRHEAAIADALLNPRDRPYSVEEFLAFLDGAGLRFGRWIRQAEYSSRCGLFRSSPHGARLERLTASKEAAAVELFRGNVLRHSAVAYRGDGAAPRQPGSVRQDKWERFVPHHAHGTVRVHEQLPRGAAAVLINPAHTQPDIYLPVDQRQLLMFDAIDNHRSVGSIGQEFGDTDAVMDFVETLWRHDLIVFDASLAPGNMED